MDKSKIGLLVSGFVIILIGLTFFQAAVTTIGSATRISTTTDESVTITGGSGALANDPIVGLTFFGNSTNNTNKSPLIVFGAQVNFSRNGTIQVTQNFNHTNAADGNFVFGNGVYTANYTYEGANYITSGSARSISSLIPLFMGMVIMIVGVGIAYAGLKDEFGNVFG